MKNIAAQLESYYKEHPIQMDDRKTILEALYWLYVESAPTDSEKLRRGYARLRMQLHFLKPKEYDAVFDTVSELCNESEQSRDSAGCGADDGIDRCTVKVEIHRHTKKEQVSTGTCSFLYAASFISGKGTLSGIP